METNKQWKRVPFDIELAKDIQSGKVKGRIVTDRAQVISRILCHDKKATNDGHIVALVDCNQMEYVGIFSNDGRCFDKEAEGIGNLYIELPEETPEEQHPIEESELYQAGYKVGFEAGKCVAFDEKKGCAIKEETPKHEFKPFDKVLVRDDDECLWNADFYSHFSDGLYRCVSCGWRQCIPYEGNEHLVGTTNNPE